MRLQGFENYHELYDWSINQRSLFWEAIVDFCDIQFSKKPEINLIEGVDMVSDVWFPDAKLNFAEHLLKYKGSRAAIIFRGEENQRKEISFDQLRLQVASLAYHLKAIGLRKIQVINYGQ